MLSLTNDMALDVIRASENKFDESGLRGQGHTLRKHVNITKVGLQERFEQESTSGEVQLYTAFVGVHDCAAALAQAVGALSAQPFIREFQNAPYGTRFDTDQLKRTPAGATFILPSPMRVRYGSGAGMIPLQQFCLKAVKMRDRPYNLHLITFYLSIWF